MAKPTAAPKNECDEASDRGCGECFVIMPITDPEGYSPGHFSRVYEHVLKPAIRAAGYAPKRADDVRETNLIQLDLLRRLLEAPMAICDVSARNPNVFFELGLRQAFDKPVVIVQEHGTPPVFDTSSLRYTPYRHNLLYHEVLEDQHAIRAAIDATRRAATDPGNVNSLVRLLSLTGPATMPEISDRNRDPGYQLVQAELTAMRREIRSLRSGGSHTQERSYSRSQSGSAHGGRTILLKMPRNDKDTDPFILGMADFLKTSVVWDLVDDREALVEGYGVMVSIERSATHGEIADALSFIASIMGRSEVPEFRVL